MWVAVPVVMALGWSGWALYEIGNQEFNQSWARLFVRRPGKAQLMWNGAKKMKREMTMLKWSHFEPLVRKLQSFMDNNTPQ